MTVATTPDGARDVVFTFSLETLADARDRGFARPPDRILQTLLTDPRVGRVLVVDAERWLVALLRRGPMTWPEVLGPRRPHLRPWRLHRREATSLPEIEAASLRHDRRLARAAARHGLHRPALLTFDPLVAGFVDAGWAGPVTFYARDDWAAFGPRREWWPAYEEAYARIRARERAVLAISAPLLDRIAPTGPGAVVPNGVDPAEWRTPAPPPPWFADLPRPVHVYVGTIDDRVDESLVAEVAALEGSVVLLGPCDESSRRSRLEALGAVIAVATDRAEVAAMVSAADVGLIPHTRTELTSAMSPLKLYEYRAAGLPVASVDLPPVAAEAAGDPAIVLADPDPGAFAAAARTAAARGRDDEADRRERLERTSWRGRHAAALDVVLR